MHCKTVAKLFEDIANVLGEQPYQFEDINMR